jgi:hypothetical protein
MDDLRCYSIDVPSCVRVLSLSVQHSWAACKSGAWYRMPAIFFFHFFFFSKPKAFVFLARPGLHRLHDLWELDAVQRLMHASKRSPPEDENI